MAIKFFDLNWLPFSIQWRSKGAFRDSIRVLDASTQFNNYSLDKEKLAIALSNPALLKVITLQCDLFSLGKVYVYKDGNQIENHEFLKMIKKPNPFQNQSQFLWDYMFWLMLGTNYCYSDSKVISENNKLYHLTPHKLDFPTDIQQTSDHLVFSKAKENEIPKTQITYRYDNGDTFKFNLSKLIINTDLTNGIGNYFKGASRIDALTKPLSNSEFALDAKNVNVRYSAKFLVGSGTSSIDSRPLSDESKKDIEDKIDDTKTVRAIKQMIEIKRYVSDMGALKLDESYYADYFIIGSMYGIPRDVLEAHLEGSTYENQEKARGAHVSYCLSPKGNQFFDSFERYFGLSEKGENILIDWSHLPFMQVFEKQKAETNKINIETLNLLVNMGVPLTEINEYLDTNFSKANASEIKQSGTGGNKESQSGKDIESKLD
jgi:hypothetical protein